MDPCRAQCRGIAADGIASAEVVPGRPPDFGLSESAITYFQFVKQPVGLPQTADLAQMVIASVVASFTQPKVFEVGHRCPTQPLN